MTNYFHYDDYFRRYYDDDNDDDDDGEVQSSVCNLGHMLRENAGFLNEWQSLDAFPMKFNL